MIKELEITDLNQSISVIEWIYDGDDLVQIED